LRKVSGSAATTVIAAPRGLAEHAHDGLAFEIGPRPICHLYLLEVTSVAPQVDTQIASCSDPTVNTKILSVPIEVDYAQRHHMHVVAIGMKAEGSEGTVSVPILRLADVDRVPVNSEPNGFFSKQNLPVGFADIGAPIPVSLRRRRLQQNEQSNSD